MRDKLVYVAVGDSSNVEQFDTDDVFAEANILIGQTVSVHMPSTPSTGFCWLMIVDGNSKAAKISRDELIPSSEDDDDPVMAEITGRTVYHEIVIEGRSQGNTTFQFGYRRPWEDDPPIRTVTILVKVSQEV